MTALRQQLTAASQSALTTKLIERMSINRPTYILDRLRHNRAGQAAPAQLVGKDAS